LYEPPVHPDQKHDAVGRGREPLDAGDREAFLDLFLIELPVSVIPVGRPSSYTVKRRSPSPKEDQDDGDRRSATCSHGQRDPHEALSDPPPES